MAKNRNDQNQPGPEFLQKTRYHSLGPSDQQRGLPAPPLEEAFQGETIPLPKPDELPERPVDMQTLVTHRQSVRRFEAGPMSLETLSFLLWSTQGVRRRMQHALFRTVPSAGARHPFETYLVINEVESLEPGLYRYLSLSHELGLVRKGSAEAMQLFRNCFNQEMVLDCQVNFIWTAHPYRTTWRYGQRGYRYLFLDVGHVCQNLYLASEACDCGTCAIAAFDDDAMNQMIGLDGSDGFVIYLATCGIKRKDGRA